MGPLRILIWGGGGRLGRAVGRQAEARGHDVAGLVSRGSARSAAAEADVVVDASGPDALTDVVAACRSTGSALVECVSNLPSEAQGILRALAMELPVLRAQNLAVGHYLQEQLVRTLGDLVAGGAVSGDVAVWERHPTTKAHRPSATAVRLAAVWEEAAGRPPADVASLRGGSPVSDHAVLLALPGASVSIEHRVADIGAAAFGAVLAAEWLVGKDRGLHTMNDVYANLFAERRRSGAEASPGSDTTSRVR
jgi:4-hydroxy-tetrahydrodipicolinate reductase